MSVVQAKGSCDASRQWTMSTSARSSQVPVIESGRNSRSTAATRKKKAAAAVTDLVLVGSRLTGASLLQWVGGSAAARPSSLGFRTGAACGAGRGDHHAQHREPLRPTQ